MALPAQSAAPDESQQKLRRGEVSLDDYLEERVEVALAHVKARVNWERLQMLREVVREQLRARLRWSSQYDQGI